MAVGIASIVLAIGIGVIVSLWSIGGRSQTFETEIEIDRSPAEVFAWLVEPDKLTQWIGGMVESRPVGDSSLRVGARSIEVIEERGRRTEMESEVLRLEDGSLLEVKLEAPFLVGTNRFEMNPAAGRTRLRQTLTVNYRGVARLFGPFMRGSVRTKLEEDLQRLESLMEG